MKNNITISIASREDIRYILDIENLMFDDPWNESMLLSELSNIYSYMYVAKIDDIICAYALMWYLSDHTEINKIAVGKSFLRNKIGTFLIERMLKDSKDLNVNEILLEVREQNTNAIDFYLSFGFKKIGVRSEYYKKPTDNAIIMKREI